MPHIYTRREIRQRKMKLQIYAGMYDFLSLIFGCVVLIAGIVLLTSLISWVKNDGFSSFETLFDILRRSIIRPD